MTDSFSQVTRSHRSLSVQTAPLLTIAIAAAVIAVGCSRQAPPHDDTATAIDALFAEWNRPDSPGCGVGVMRSGSIVFERGYGMANLEAKIPITPSTIFDPASVAKPFAALSIMLLADRGKLSLDDEVWKHLPEWADRRNRVTIRDLVAHSAGLRDVFLLLELAPPAPPGVDINEHILRILSRQRGVNFRPATEFSYNNGGYNVLGSIVARLSGQPFREFVAANIFGPLGMTRSSFRGGTAPITRDHALGYHSDGKGFQLAREGGIDTSAIVGNSGLFTTVADVLRFAQNLGDARVGSRASLELMQTPVSLGANGTSPYGLGLEIADDDGLKTVGHAGGDRGIAAYVVRYPAHDLNVAVLCNMDNLNVDARVRTLARETAALFLPARSKSAPANAAPTASGPALSSDELQSKAGLYRDVSTDIYGRVYVRNSKLWVSMDAGDGDGDSVELRPLDANRFSVPGTAVVAEFVPPADRRPRQIRVTGAGPKPLVSEQVAEGFTPTAAQLREFEGSYNSVDLDVTYTITARPSGLVLQIPGRPEISLTPVFPNAFYGSLVDLIEFTGAEGRPRTAFTINRATVRNLRFDGVR